jgi:predicted ATPase
MQGSDLSRAVRYLLQAGQNALRLSAHVEALKHFRHGLTLLADLPETVERQNQELWLQTGVGLTQMAAKGFAAPEVEHAFLRARALCQQIGETPELFSAVAGLRTFYQARGELRTARQLAEQLLRLAHDIGDPAHLAIAHASMQATLYLQGELLAARTHGEQAIVRFATSPPLPLAFSYGPNLRVLTCNTAAAVLHALGYSDQSRQQSRAALALAQELGQTPTIAAALSYATVMHGAYGDWAAMQACSAELIALATTHNLPFWWAQGTYNHGIALTQQGDLTEGIGQIRQGLTVYRAAGSTVGIARILGWLAEAYRRLGQIGEGLHVLDEAFAVMEQNDERIWEAELYRRKGELTLQKEFKVQSSEFKVPNPQPLIPSTQEAEACFLQAIDIARRQQAKAYELRAVLSLSRLWRQQGKNEQARQMLAEVYGWFTEGFDTADVQEAKAVLEQLTPYTQRTRQTQ